MTDEELKRCQDFLDYFDVKYDGDTICLTNGGNSCIMNPKTEWKEFLGHSINGVAQAVAKKMSKKVEWKQEN